MFLFVFCRCLIMTHFRHSVNKEKLCWDFGEPVGSRARTFKAVLNKSQPGFPLLLSL